MQEQGKGVKQIKYDRKYTKQAYQLCLLGATDKDLATFFEVAESTINEWKHDHKEFSESIKKGKVLADARVASALHKKALNGDTTAKMFWLKNRQPQTWRDKQEVDHLSNGKELKRFTLNVKPDSPEPC